MTNPTSLSELVLRWQELRERGQSVSAEELCADCPERLEELKRQIEALHSMQHFLGASDSDASSAATPRTMDTGGWEPADHLGDEAASADSGAALVGSRYRPLRFHAKGGLGEVLVAQDEELSREVALKRIRRTHVHDDNSRRRFLREGEITGSLEHPGVVPVYGLTRDASGQPCYAMRFIRGQTLQEAIARFHAADKAGRALVLRQLLSRFVAVCNTLAYAHSRGVIHRDLKPSNIMLGDYGETLVIDWGLAKRLSDRQSAAASDGDDSPHTPFDGRREGTATGELLGTPAYMSPEQASGRHETVGPASDIYSLGATLYALLTGRPPFDGDDFMEVLTKVKQGDFPPPRQLRPDVPRGLEAICLKAMAHDPATRYATALELAADVEHWLADEPVRAYREPWTGRARRWLRRHRGITASAAGLLVAAVAALAIGIVVVNGEKNRTEQQKQRAERALTAETAAWKQTREALNTLTDEVMEELLGKQPVLGDKEKKFLRKALGFYERFAAERGEDEESRAVAAEGRFRVAKLRAFLGDNVEAEKDYRIAVVLYAKLADDFPAVPEYRNGLAISHNNLGGTLHRGLGRLVEAESAYRKAIALLEKLADDFPTVPRYREEQAGAYFNRGELLSHEGKHEEAESAYLQAIALQEKLAGDFPEVPQYREEMARGYRKRGILLALQGKHTEAESAYRQAIALQEKLANQFPAVPLYREEMALGYLNWGVVLRNLAKHSEAEAAYRQAIALQKKLINEFPAVPDYRQELATSHNNLGNLLMDLRKGEEAEAVFRRAIALREKLMNEFRAVPDYRHELATSHNNLGNLLMNLGKSVEAEAAYRQANALWKKLSNDFPAVPEYYHGLAGSHNNLSNLLRSLRRLVEAEAACNQAIALREKLTNNFPDVPRYRQELARAYFNFGELLSHEGKHEEAESAYRQAIAVQMKLAGDLPAVLRYQQELAGSYVNFGNLFQARGKPEDALEWYDKAIPLLQSIVAKNGRVAIARLYLRNAHWSRAGALDKLGRYLESARDWQRAAELDDGRNRSAIRLRQSAALARIGKQQEAVNTVEELLTSSNPKGKMPPSGSLLYDAACVYALSAASVTKDAKLREQYATRAIDLLRQAKKAGLFKDPRQVENFKKDADLDALRQRDDFRQFAAELPEKDKARSSMQRQSGHPSNSRPGNEGHRREPCS